MSEYNRLVTAFREAFSAAPHDHLDGSVLRGIGAVLEALESELRDLYESGYNDGQNSPNGYSEKKLRDEAVQEFIDGALTINVPAAQGESKPGFAWGPIQVVRRCPECGDHECNGECMGE